MRRIVCENQQQQQIEFRYNGYPLRLSDTAGFSSAEYTVNTTQNSGQDGETYNGAQANKRNPVITANIFAAYQSWGDRLRSFFQPRSWGTVYAYDGGDGRKATYQVEKIDIEETGTVRDAVISLICPDPKFYALTDQLTQLAVWAGGIEFPFEIPQADEFTVETKVNTLIGNVHNDSAVSMGLTIKFMATGTVVNPSLYDVNRHLLLQANITMHAGDCIIITTGDGNKRAQMVSGSTVTSISNLLQYPPAWLKAYQGDNLFRYNASSGIDALSVLILSTPAYWGV